MLYFYVTTLIHVGISIGILGLILHFSKINYQRRNRKPQSFLLPIGITCLFLVQVVLFSGPRILDVVYVLKGSYMSAVGQVNSVNFLNTSFYLDQVKYRHNPFLYKPKAGDKIEVRYTPYSHLVIDLTLVSKEVL